MWVAIASLLAVLTLNSAAWADDTQATCRYFSNQAFQDRHAGMASTFRMQLAQDCVDARIYARSDNLAVRNRAVTYLEQLEAYRIVIARMMVDRVSAPEAQRATPGLRRYTLPSIASVSWPGAYLIARNMGLMDTHADWTAWRQSSTSADARLRID